MALISAIDPRELDRVRELWLEYAKALGFSLCFQGLDQELATLPGKYAPPRGRLYLVKMNQNFAGTVALRPLNETICEMKRLYIRPEFRGLGAGRKVVLQTMREARQAGYCSMCLDTIPGQMDSAICLYRSLGFREIEPYYPNPLPNVLFLEARLDMSGAM